VVLRRDDRLLVLAAARPARLQGSYDSVRATLVAGRPSDFGIVQSAARIEGSGVARASAELEDAGWILSLEVVGGEWTARARHGAPAPQLVNGFGISDPVLVDERVETGLPLPEGMLPSTDLSGRARVGVYFEVYGTNGEEPLRVSIAAERTNRSFLRRLTGALGLTSNGVVSVNWSETADASARNRSQRYVSLDLAGLEAGQHRLTLTVQRADGTTATSSRPIRIDR
jgi:hypothetical protein